MLTIKITKMPTISGSPSLAIFNMYEISISPIGQRQSCDYGNGCQRNARRNARIVRSTAKAVKKTLISVVSVVATT